MSRGVLPYGEGKESASFFLTSNSGSAENELTGVTSTAVDRAMLGRNTTTPGNAGYMRPVGSVIVPAAGTLAMSPPGMDVMVTARGKWRAGDPVPFVLHFRHSGRIRPRRWWYAPARAETVSGADLAHSSLRRESPPRPLFVFAPLRYRSSGGSSWRCRAGTRSGPYERCPDGAYGAVRARHTQPRPHHVIIQMRRPGTACPWARRSSLTPCRAATGRVSS
ncbi:copper chaperone PCu(A)C [Streptomyces collinus]|uniref:copper chaperone PCu(A)C n=1 Tax=Streptomyces collinus TaxID=42684 RepID=UPI003980E52F